jgi:PhnB protein
MSESVTTSIKPFLTVNNGIKAVAFYSAAFGAIEMKRFTISGNKISSVLEIENAEFYVGDEEPEFNNLGPGEERQSPVRIILTTQNADQLFDNAIKAGAQQICPMTTEEDWRIGKLKDPFGHIWELGYTL